MSFLVFFLCGIAGGVLGGMGMGGGTVLIPLLTLVCGVSQSAAQGVNLLSFLPMSLAALSIHAKNGLVAKGDILPLVLPALLFSALFSLLAARLPAAALGKGFAIFIIFLSICYFREAVCGFRSENSQKKFGK